jgi:phage repressor protein C with HTH and peptisase S24 domain
MKENFAEKAMAIIRHAVNSQYAGNVLEASRAWDVNNNNLYRWLKGERSPQLEMIGPILDKLNATIAKPKDELIDYALVPRVTAVAGAGESFEVSSMIAGYYAFRLDFLRASGIPQDKAVTMFVRGDSMDPVIKDGDMILIDQSDFAPRDGFIYLVNLAGALMVKRLFRLPNGWRIYSENAKYLPTDVVGDELESLKVFGRVRWFGRVLA